MWTGLNWIRTRLKLDTRSLRPSVRPLPLVVIVVVGSPDPLFTRGELFVFLSFFTRAHFG